MQLEKCSPFPKTNKQFYRYRSIPLFFYVYCICREAYFHDDIKSDDGYFIANHGGCGKWYHNKCMNIQVKAFLSTSCNENALCAENKLHENENKALICEGRM